MTPAPVLLKTAAGGATGPRAVLRATTPPCEGKTRRAARQALPQDMGKVQRELCGYERKSR
jgi:hypothetical protein